MTEYELIEKLTKKIPRKNKGLLLGIGDDCSIHQFGSAKQVVSCDSLVENIHFKKSWGPMQWWGHKAALSAISDIYAMGATPHTCWIHLSLPGNYKFKEIKDFYSGFLKSCKNHHVIVAGGNISKTKNDFHAVTTVMGKAGKNIWRRDNAQVGDTIYLSGPTGLASLALSACQKKSQSKLNPKILKSFYHPTLRPDLVAFLQKKNLVNAAIDVSDGLLKDLRHIANNSGVSLHLDTQNIPIHPLLEQNASKYGKDPLELALSGGEDYTLIFTSKAPSKAFATWGCTAIGTVKKGPAKLVASLSFSKEGFDHSLAGS